MNHDDKWVEQLKAMDEQAIELLVQKFEHSVYRFFFLDHRMHHVAEDQTAEVFLQLVRSLARFRGSSEQLTGFVYSIARHVKHSDFRRKKHRTDQSDLSRLVDSATTPIEALENQDEINRVLSAIAHLDSEVRDVMLLYYVEQLSITRIATAFEIPIGTVKSHLHRGRERIKQLLERCNHETS